MCRLVAVAAIPETDIPRCRGPAPRNYWRLLYHPLYHMGDVVSGKGLTARCGELLNEASDFIGEERHYCRSIMSSQECIANNQVEQNDEISVVIYVAEHCFVCEYSYEIAELIEQEFPQVYVRIVNLTQTTESIPDAVFATPTYLLNGQVWSLGNPSPEQVTETLNAMLVPGS